MNNLKRLNKYVIVYLAGIASTIAFGFYLMANSNEPPKYEPVQILKYDVDAPNFVAANVEMQTDPTDHTLKLLLLHAVPRGDGMVTADMEFEDEYWGSVFTYFVHYKQNGMNLSNIWQDFNLDGRFDLHIKRTSEKRSTILANIDDRWVPGTLNSEENEFLGTDGTKYHFMDIQGWVRN